MGTKTLLNGVNDVLKKLGAIKGNSGELASLSDSQRQVLIDVCVQAWNATVIDLYASSDKTLPNESKTSTVVLVAGDRDYALPSDLSVLTWPIKNLTNGYEIDEYPGGWEALKNDQLQPNNYTGRPIYGVIRPTDGQLYLDRIPTSADAGITYTVYYDKALAVSTASATFPFSDDVYYTLLSAVAEAVKMDTDEQSDARYMVSRKKYKDAIGVASGLVSFLRPMKYWGPERLSTDASADPLDE